MELNTNYYTNVTEDATAGTRLSEFSGLPVNTEFDLSGAYAMQGGEFAPCATWGVVHAGDLGTLNPITQTETHYDATTLNHSYVTGSAVPLFLTTSSTHTNTNGYSNPCGARLPESYSKNQSYDLSSRAKNYNYSAVRHWSPTAPGLEPEDTPLYTMYDGGGILCGFSYRDTVADARVFRAYSDKPEEGARSWAAPFYSGPLKDWDPAAYPYITGLEFRIFAQRNLTATLSRKFNPSFAHNGVNKKTGIATPISTNFEKFDISIYNGNYNIDNITSQYSAAYNLCGFYVSNLLTISDSGYKHATTAPYGIGYLLPLYPFLRNNYTEGHSRVYYWWEMSKEQVYKVFATWGLYFTDNETAANVITGSAATSDNLFLPIADPDGVYRGSFVSGEDIKDAPNADWGGADDPWGWWEDNGVSPKPKPTPDETDKTPLAKPAISAFGSFNRAYAMTQTTLNDLQNYLWNINDTVFDEIVAGLKLFGENPLNAIIDCRMYPFDILSYISSSGAQKITLGRRESNVTGIYLGNTTNCIIDCGSVYWARYTNTFLDYSPYSSGELYVPYIGRFTLDPDKYCGHTVQAFIIVDFMTGGAQCVVFSDGIACDYKSGQIGVDIPVSGINAAQWASGIVGGIAGTANSVVGTAGAIAAGNPIGAIAGAISTVNSAVQTTALPSPSLQQASTATSAAAQWLPQQAYLTVHVPISAEASTYGATVGYACQYTGAIGSQSGYTVCANVRLDSTFATQAERDEIVQLLTTGIYV